MTYFRRGCDDGYAFLPTPVSLATIACAAYVKPPTRGAQLAEREQEGTRSKLRAVFTAAERNQHDSLVLSALGCGAFQNPPHAIAALIKEVSEEFRGAFRRVVIAIVENDGRDNLDPFFREFPPETS